MLEGQTESILVFLNRANCLISRGSSHILFLWSEVMSTAVRIGYGEKSLLWTQTNKHDFVCLAIAPA